MQVGTFSLEQSAAGLLQLPDTALHLVLQQLDACSLACTAVTCSKLRRHAPAVISEVAVYRSTAEKAESFNFWLQQHSITLTHLTECTMYNSEWEPEDPVLFHLPCPQLRQLHLHKQCAQLGPSGGRPGVLHDCSGLTALELETCGLINVPAAAAAIAAMPGLKQLSLAVILQDLRASSLYAQLQLPLQLTYLGIEWPVNPTDLEEDPLASQLSGLVNLGYLELIDLPYGGVPGGFSSQLTQLTCLDVSYGCVLDSFGEQLQYLSSLTALRELSVDYEELAASDLSGIQHLSQLTSLQLKSSELELSTASTRSWIHLTKLETLRLQDCEVQPLWLLAHTQLRELSLVAVQWHPCLIRHR